MPPSWAYRSAASSIECDRRAVDPHDAIAVAEPDLREQRAGRDVRERHPVAAQREARVLGQRREVGERVVERLLVEGDDAGCGRGGGRRRGSRGRGRGCRLGDRRLRRYGGPGHGRDRGAACARSRAPAPEPAPARVPPARPDPARPAVALDCGGASTVRTPSAPYGIERARRVRVDRIGARGRGRARGGPRSGRRRLRRLGGRRGRIRQIGDRRRQQHVVARRSAELDSTIWFLPIRVTRKPSTFWPASATTWVPWIGS